jgi:hypothetical protein
MNTNTRNSRILNSILPARNTQTPGTYISNSISSYTPSFDMMYIVWAVVILLVAGVLYWFKDDLQRGWDDLTKSVSVAMNGSSAPASASVQVPAKDTSPSMVQGAEEAVGSVVERVLPSSGQQVFNVSSNKYTYYDAEPLCKALGAELATYDQVKEAWSKGADWCNYGWVKGQMAVYPTSQETFDKTQSGPDEEKSQCGQPGVNGGYFDNPELRYGVTCYGKKPTNNLKNSADITRNTPTSPDALSYDKKVATFKQQASTMAILPNNSHSWN